MPQILAGDPRLAPWAMITDDVSLFEVRELKRVGFPPVDRLVLEDCATGLSSTVDLPTIRQKFRLVRPAPCSAPDFVDLAA